MTMDMAVDHADMRLGSLDEIGLADLLGRLDGLGQPT
jgi:hypothetical protein